MTDDARGRLVLLVRQLGGAPSRTRLQHAARIVLADAGLDELVRLSAFDELCGVLRSAGAHACALGLLDLLVELARAEHDGVGAR